MILEGTVEEIIFRADDTGFTVGMLEHNSEYTCFVGKMLPVKAGEMLRLEGEFVTNQKYGEQFAFNNATKITPKTSESIRKYLGSGIIKGVGEKTAQAIVKKFGEKTLEIIEFQPEKLTEIKGISLNKAYRIFDQFKELKNVQEVILFLQGYDITINRALKIYEIYGAKTIEKIKENPYVLIEDVDGIGFLSADKIAAKMGIETTSGFRFRAGILHILKTSSEKNGHTFLPKPLLFKETSALLSLPEEESEAIFESTCENLKIEDVIKIMWQGEFEIVMLSKFYYIENTVAKKLAMLTVANEKNIRDCDEEIALFEKLNKIKFHDEQINAIKTAVREGCCVITGGPGTGKTTIIKCVISILKQSDKKIALMAPTGRAAKRLNDTTGEEAKTIHRTLGVDFLKRDTYFSFDENNTLPFDTVIVDEVSMVDCTLMSSLLKAMPRGCKFIMVGDKDQLPSVGAGNVLSDILSSKVVPSVYLTEIFRQGKDSYIILNAHKINKGIMPELDNSSKDFFFEKKEDPAGIKDSVIALVHKRIPDYFGIESGKIQVLAPLKIGISGTVNLNKELQAFLNPFSFKKNEVIVGESIFRTGDKVMQTVNNYEIEWKKYQGGKFLESGEGIFNGDIGIISEIVKETGDAQVSFEDGRVAQYPRHELFQLSLAYAITIHKSQGCEFDAVVIPVIAGAPLIMTRNLIYTAITRAKQLVVLVGQKENLMRMIKNNRTEKRYTLLESSLISQFKKIKEMF